MIRALIFDFDGLILDTETPEFTSWSEVFASHGHTFSLSEWAKAIGTRGGFDAYAHLESLTGRPVDREGIRTYLRKRNAELIESAELQPGVAARIDEAHAAGLSLGVASSSDRVWVEGHLRRHDLLARFLTISCGDEVERPKPDPELYVRTLAGLSVAAAEAVAFEDSPNGIAAAKAAGVYCIAVPNRLTAQLDLSAADRLVSSLAGLSIASLLTHLSD